MRTMEEGISFITVQIIFFFYKLNCTARNFIAQITDTNYGESFVVWTVLIVV